MKSEKMNVFASTTEPAVSTSAPSTTKLQALSIYNDVTSEYSYQNTTLNVEGGNRSEVPQDLSGAFKLAAILVPIFFGIIFCVGIVGNSLVITVMTKMYRFQPQGLNNTNRFILNLAISDLFFLVFCVPFQAPVYSMEGWPFGAFMCVFCDVCQKVTMIASVYTLVALSFDRFFAVVYATSAKQLRTRANANRGLIFIWVASIGIGIPAALTRLEIEYNGLMICVPNWRMKIWYKWYQLSIFILGYVLPLLIILSCYVGVLYAMCQNARSSAVIRSKSARGSRKRVTRVVVMVVIVFAIDWFLHHLMTLWVLFGDFPFTAETFALKLLAHCLSYANSCVNPVIYAFVSNRFRSDFKKAFTCQYITDAVVNMKAYSRNIVVSFRKQLRNSASAAQASSSGNDASDSRKVFRPRPPVISASAFKSARKHKRSEESTEATASTCVLGMTPILMHHQNASDARKASERSIDTACDDKQNNEAGNPSELPQTQVGNTGQSKPPNDSAETKLLGNTVNGSAVRDVDDVICRVKDEKSRRKQRYDEMDSSIL